jgi:predicted transcriptional regulator
MSDSKSFINANSIVFGMVLEVLSKKEQTFLYEFAKYINEDNIACLYDKVDGKVVVETIAEKMHLSKRSAQNLLYKILAKQNETDFFLRKVCSNNEGEYFINPELYVKSQENYDRIQKDIVPQLIEDCQKKFEQLMA